MKKARTTIFSLSFYAASSCSVAQGEKESCPPGGKEKWVDGKQAEEDDEKERCLFLIRDIIVPDLLFSSSYVYNTCSTTP